jgi:hypothetical protein
MAKTRSTGAGGDADQSPVPSDTSIRAPTWAVMTTTVALLGAALLVLLNADDSRNLIIVAYLLLALVAGVVTFAIAGASANVKTQTAQFGGSAAVFIFTFILLLKAVTPANTLFGQVVQAADVTSGISKATVTFAVEGTKTLRCDDSGDFKVNISNYLGRKAVVAAKADGYAPVRKELSLAPNMDKVYLELSRPMPIPPSRASSRPTTRSVVRIRFATRPVTGPSYPPGGNVRSFSFHYQFEPPGRRDWVYRGNDTWAETYPDGRTDLFRGSTPTEVDGCRGIVTRLSNDNGDDDLEIFIPNQGSAVMWVRFRRGNTAWEMLGEMFDVK